jgi:hypothetical protein
MATRGSGPRRSGSVQEYLRGTRVIALVAVVALAGGVVWDALAGQFWSRHALLAGLVASVIVVMLSVAVVNEVIERRRRRRWSVLAQYVMLELVRNSRLVWTGVMELAGAIPPDVPLKTTLEQGRRIAQDRELALAIVGDVVTDADRRHELHDAIAEWVRLSDEVLGRWAGVMLNADAYAEIIDRHVELASDIAWLASVLDTFEPVSDPKRRRRGGVSPAGHIAGEIGDERLAERVVAITQLAEELDRLTLAVALHLVPIEWWEARLGATLPSEVHSAIRAGTI